MLYLTGCEEPWPAQPSVKSGGWHGEPAPLDGCAKPAATFTKKAPCAAPHRMVNVVESKTKSLLIVTHVVIIPGYVWFEREEHKYFSTVQELFFLAGDFSLDHFAFELFIGFSVATKRKNMVETDLLSRLVKLNSLSFAAYPRIQQCGATRCTHQGRVALGGALRARLEPCAQAQGPSVASGHVCA